jgi:hypothetical protein
MARKKTARKKRAIQKRSSSKKKAPAKKKAALKTKPASRRSASKKSVRKSAAKKKVSSRKPSRRKPGGTGRSAGITYPTPVGRRGLGAGSAGQSGDTQGLSRREFDDSESVEELMEEGQYMEAEAVSGVENARDADQGEVRTTQFPEDDVPEEYIDEEDQV